MATPSRIPLRTGKNIKYVGHRPEDDQENHVREKLCNIVKGVGCFHELAPEKLYLVNLAKDVFADVFIDEHDDQKSPFIFWGFHDNPQMAYEAFNMDFGPFNLSLTHQFCSQIKLWLDTQERRDPDKYIVVVLDDRDTKRKLNATLLVAIASMVLLNLTDEEVIQRLNFTMMHKGKIGEPKNELIFRERKKFSDVSGNQTILNLTLEDCIRAFYAAIRNKFYDYYEFDHTEYQFYETVMTGDHNWIVPGKLLAFAGPTNKPDPGAKTYAKHPPNFFYHYFKDHNVTTIVRLNDPEYDSWSFTELGFDHRDLIFPDGYPPTSTVSNKFISIVDQAKGAVAVHCYAGIGRTGTLIAAYLVARYNFTPQMAIAWTRICRPGSVIGEQQDWLLRHFEGHVSASPVRPVKSRKRTPVTSSSSETEPVTVDDPKITYSEAEKTYGQAKALVLAKTKREHYERPCTRHSSLLKGSVLGKDDEKELVINLGRTVPLMVSLADFKGLEDGQIPEFYHIKDGKYVWKVKYPEVGYVALKPSMVDMKREMDYAKSRRVPLNQVFAEPILSLRHEDIDESFDNLIDQKSVPKMKPTVYFKVDVWKYEYETLGDG